MVNRTQRTMASSLVRKLLAGESTNDEFENQFPRDPADPALQAVYRWLWFFWDDRKTHKLTEGHALKEEGRQLFERCAAFLDSDLEYEWPSSSHMAPVSLILLRLLRLRKATEDRERKEMERIRSFGDYDVWPFLRTQDWRRG
jgi:hypothetical protein